MVQFVGVPCSFAFGALADQVGPKRALFLGLAVYVGISILGYFMRSTWHFFALAFLVVALVSSLSCLSFLALPGTAGDVLAGRAREPA